MKQKDQIGWDHNAMETMSKVVEDGLNKMRQGRQVETKVTKATKDIRGANRIGYNGFQGNEEGGGSFEEKTCVKAFTLWIADTVVTHGTRNASQQKLTKGKWSMADTAEKQQTKLKGKELQQNQGTKQDNGCEVGLVVKR